MRSTQPCSAATCTGVRPSRLFCHEGHPRRSSCRTASTWFQAAAQYSGVQPSLSFTAAAHPCHGPANEAEAR